MSGTRENPVFPNTENKRVNLICDACRANHAYGTIYASCREIEERVKNLTEFESLIDYQNSINAILNG